MEPKLKYERIGNAMNTILNGEECASCMAVHTKVHVYDLVSAMYHFDQILNRKKLIGGKVTLFYWVDALDFGTSYQLSLSRHFW